MILGAVDGELRVRVAGRASSTTSAAADTVRLGVAAVDVDRRDRPQRHLARDLDQARPEVQAGHLQRRSGRSTETTTRRRGAFGSCRQQPQRALRRPGERDVFELLLVALGIPLPQRRA